ncbi:translocation/assembly module TamB domain-containing protein [candidate division TA06 bacterium]|uniref:Translocation/assembly module TamB domain-containing protein n=1 Tax=candidate division TA06 bacterium TaxID=2250710 RepID=A0A933IA06_UNCT6|nr:translocation/assembly module TamB domain-containing protein [candidate division TA06 bacterium]
MPHKTRNIIVITSAAVVLLSLAGLALYLNSRSFKEKLKTKADLTLSNVLGREFTIDSASVQLPMNIVLHGLKLASEDSLKNGMMLEVPRIKVVIHPWVSLTKGRITVNQVGVYDARARLVRRSDGSWNFSNLFKSDSTKPKGKTNFPPLEISTVEIGNLKVMISPGPDSQLVEKINLMAGLKMGGPKLSLNLKDFSAYIPDRKFSLNKGNGSLAINGDTVKLDGFGINLGSSRLGLSLWLDGKSKKYGLSRAKLKLNMSDVARAARLKAEDFDGQIIITAGGKGSLDNPSANVDIRSAACGIGGARLERLNVRLSFRDQMLLVEDIDLASGPGTVNGTGQLDLKARDYDLQLSLNRVDLGTMLPMAGKALKTNINGVFKLQGQGLEPKKIKARADLVLNRSSVNDIPVDEFRCFVRAEGADIAIDQIRLRSGQAQLEAKGDIYKEAVSLELETDEIDLAQFGPLFGLKDLAGRLRFTGLVSGSTKDPDIIGSFRLKEAGLAGISCLYFDGNMSVKSIAKSPLGDSKFTLTGIEFGKQSIEKIEMLAELRGLDRGGFSVHIVKDSITEGLLSGQLEVAGKNISLIVYKLFFNSGYQIIANSQPLAVDIKSGAIDLKPGKLILGRGSLLFSGNYRNNKDFQVDIKGRDIDSRRILELMQLDKTVHGLLDFELAGSGNLASPKYSLKLNVGNLRFEQFTADNLFLDVAYADRVVRLNQLAISRYGSVSELSARIPVNLAAGPEMGKLLDQPMEGQVSLRDIGTWAFFPMADFLSVYEGRIDLSVALSGTPFKPLLNGDFSINNAKMVLRPFGMYLRDVIVRAHFNADSLVIDGIKGTTENQGLVMINRGEILLERFIPSKMYFLITTREAPIRNIPFIEANVDARIEINGTVNHPKISGNVKVNTALISMPFAPAEEPPPPEGEPKPMDLDLAITGPQGIWLRNNDADIELKIDNLNVRMQQNLLFLSGRLETIRGTYKALDRQFDITSGQLTFTNSALINPELNLSAQTSVDQPTPEGGTSKVKIFLKIQGTALQPKLSFTSDPTMSEQDILTMISVGRKLDDENGNGDLAGQVTQRGVDYLSNMLLGKLQQKNIGLVDVVRLKTYLTGEDKGAQVTLGKYVTRKVFVSYSQGLSANLSTEFTAEYLFGTRSAIVAKKDDKGKFNLGLRMKFKY